MEVPNHDYTPRRVGAPFPIRRGGCRVRSMPRRSYRPLAGVSVVAVVLGILLGSNAPGRAAAQQVPVFRGGVDLVNVGVTVTDRKGNLVTDLTVDDFEIYEDGKKQTPRYFSAGLVSGPG